MKKQNDGGKKMAEFLKKRQNWDKQSHIVLYNVYVKITCRAGIVSIGGENDGRKFSLFDLVVIFVKKEEPLGVDGKISLD